MADTVFDVLLAAYDELGQLEDVTATGEDSKTAIEDTDYKHSQPDNWVGGTMFCVRDTAGAAAAPEGEFEVISAFTANGTTGTWTVSLFSANVSAGDELAVADQTYTLKTMLRLLNRALIKIGRVPLVDTSTTTTSATTEYSLPSGINGKNLRQVLISTYSDAGDRKYRPLLDWWVEPKAIGTQDVLHFRSEQDSGETLMLIYMSDHPQVWADTDAISEYVHINRVVAELVVLALRWRWRREKSDDLLKDLNEAMTERTNSRKLYKVMDPGRPSKLVMNPRR